MGIDWGRCIYWLDDIYFVGKEWEGLWSVLSLWGFD